MLFCDAVRLQNSIPYIELLEIQLKNYAIFTAQVWLRLGLENESSGARFTPYCGRR